MRRPHPHAYFSFAWSLVGLVLVAYAFMGTPAYAQLAIGTQGLSLETRPSFPQPHTSVTVSLNDYSVNAIGAEVFWFVDDVEQKESKDARSITVQAGKLGEEKVVRATLRRTDGTNITTSAVVVPTAVDLILEANTYTPSFYKGRALPSRTSILRAAAVVHDGSNNRDSSYTYRWTLGQDVLFAGPALGKNTVTFAMPLFSKDLAVEVINPEGRAVGRRSMTLEATKPELHFYEWSPLRGLYQKEVSSPFPLLGDETVIYGEPYFVQKAPSAESASFTWKIGGGIAPSDMSAIHAIVLNQETISDDTQVSLRVLTNDPVPQLLEKNFNLIVN